MNYIEIYLSSHGVVSERVYSVDGTKASILATIGDASKPGVVLSAHTDVVPVAGQPWTSPPFTGTVKDGRIVGRGATDMKGFIAVVLAHVPEFVASSAGTPIHIALSYDEEVGCKGAPDLVRAVAALPALPALAIIGEPTGLKVARAHKGKTARRVTVTGRTGHSALPHLAANAVEAAAAIVHGLGQLARGLEAGAAGASFDPPWSTLHVGSLHGGGALNLVPDHAVLEFELRHMPGEDVAALLARADSLVAAERTRLRERAPEADIIVEELSAYPALDCPGSSPALSATARLAGHNGDPVTLSFGTEAGLYAAAGIPSVVCGPGDIARAHKADEWIAVDELTAASRMMTRLAEAIRRPTKEWMRP
ncbi:hypothetical protein N825_09560 [Skermanella stibiiresistens SB22]|uniref:Peptidase M20 dimerisation domain-containing protein n=1 Tax=Skermanella stibiiresistens SB22 TaxID=1385369 RepID=W9H231_9PROT|nr:hypothetical protein N825_09560 [Skermanella stibiiresistens SB22]